MSGYLGQEQLSRGRREGFYRNMRENVGDIQYTFTKLIVVIVHRDIHMLECQIVYFKHIQFLVNHWVTASFKSQFYKASSEPANKSKQIASSTDSIYLFNRTFGNINCQILLDMKLKVNLHTHLGNSLPGTQGPFIK